QAVLREEHRALADLEVVDGADVAALLTDERACVVAQGDRLPIGAHERERPVADALDPPAVVVEALIAAVRVQSGNGPGDRLRGRAFEDGLVGTARRTVAADVADDDGVAAL